MDDTRKLVIWKGTDVRTLNLHGHWTAEAITNFVHDVYGEDWDWEPKSVWEDRHETVN
jgi:hypothetical protein